MLKKKINIGILDKIQKTMDGFNFYEKTILYALLAALSASTLITLVKISNRVSLEIPRSGGEITEGVIGSPRFINPLLAISDVDRDLTSLVYSGLMKATPEGELIGDLAEKYEVSENRLRYVFYIKEKAVFHDGVPVTSDDVVYTVGLAKNDLLKSPRRATWEGIGVEKIDERTVAFVLSEPYSPFLDNLTMGIIPIHLWGEFSPEEITFSNLNSKPIGSGPYKVAGLKKGSDGISESYTLSTFEDYALSKPFLSKISFKFYKNEEELAKAFLKKEVDGIHAISPGKAKELEEKGKNIITSPLPRIFGVFFNQNQATLFTNKEVRRALDRAISREEIITEVLQNFGRKAEGPLPEGYLIRRRPEAEGKILGRIDEAMLILERAGWKRGEDGVMVKEGTKENFRLSFSISTSNAPELKILAGLLKMEWEKIGAEVELKFFETGTLNQEVIRPRKYESLLFGEIVGRDFDLYAFWHSSQRNDPGLNISLYTNIEADRLLEKIRTAESRREKEDNYLLFEEEIRKDIPAVFIYSPDFIYATNKKIKGLRIGVVTTPAERFLNVHEWHLLTDKVWPFFIN